jgi:hypothetical protein
MLVQPLEKYFTKPVLRYRKEAFNKAFSRVSRAFFVGKVKPTRLGEVPYDGTKNSGYPEFSRKAEVYPQAIAEARQVMRGKFPGPVATFHRGKNEEQARPVFAFPFHMHLLEGRFFYPLQRELVRHHNPYVGGKAYPVLAGMLNEIRWKSRYIMEIDYSGFDGSVSARLIHAAFDVLKQSLDLTAEDDALWMKLVRYFITSPILLPDCKVVKGRRHGIPSGSMFTQLIGSIVNALAIEYGKVVLNVETSRYGVMGDDSIIGCNYRAPKLKDWAAVMLELGLTVSTAKSRVIKASESPYFLGHNWHMMRMSRDVSETIVKLLTPERVDIRLFKKETRTDALIERVRAYQDDNPASFVALQRLIKWLRHSQSPNHWDWTYVEGYGHSERMTWDRSWTEIPVTKRALRPLVGF